MTQPLPSLRRSATAAPVLVLFALGSSCATGHRFPWPATAGPAPAASFARADVTTVNNGYDRATSQVLVRRITRPSRAALDYAAYQANFMNADPPPEGDATAGGQAPHADNPFDGKLVNASLTGSLAATPLSEEERAHPVAVPPLAELLSAKKVEGADRFDDVLSAVRSESWGLPGGPQLVRQTAVLAYLHEGESHRPELWLKLEMAPWFKGFSSMPDDDGDGVANVYGKVAPDAIGDLSAIVRYVHDDYEGHVLAPAEVKGWAHQLASYWYPSYNTDLVPTTGAWPTDATEEPVRKELGEQTFQSPTVVMRGKPMGKPVYNVFLVESAGGEAGHDEPAHASAVLSLKATEPSADTKPVLHALDAELAEHGGSWKKWASTLAPFREALKGRLGGIPAEAKAFTGADGFLFFRNSTNYILGGDLAEQKGDRNPIPPIVAFRKLLARHGVDLLFVPVPTKEEIYPDEAAGNAKLGLDGKVVNPFERKLLHDLAQAGVETVDLLPAFLAERGSGSEPLFQHQDTHWTSRGLELAAKTLAARIKRYPWYKDLAAHKRAFRTQAAPFSRHGDLVSRLPENKKAAFSPESLVGQQVLGPDGQLYDDDADSPIVMLGDSFTGVFELIDCEHAGVSAHVAKDIGYPLDLVMSYGGGPNVRQKLLRRGESALGTKKLVIWLMTARDLYDFHEGWEPLPGGDATKAKFHKGH